MKIDYQIKKFEELSNLELYKILQLRSEIFVVEQNCAYQDIDNLDEKSIHILAKNNEEIIAYGRILPPKLAYNECSLGRIVVKNNYRKLKLGYKLMDYILVEIQTLYPNETIKIMAQSYLLRFYESFGFSIIGNEFLEDNIPHHYMLLEKTS